MEPQKRAFGVATNTIHNRSIRKNLTHGPAPLKPIAPNVPRETPKQVTREVLKEGLKETLKETTKETTKEIVKDTVGAENSYDPLKDLYGFDEELYQTVLKLELADDGLPDYRVNEPFDF